VIEEADSRRLQNENLGNYSTDSARWNAARRQWAQGEQAAHRVTIVEIKRERSSELCQSPSKPVRPSAQDPL
jgi:hypothetical protein